MCGTRFFVVVVITHACVAPLCPPVAPHPQPPRHHIANPAPTPILFLTILYTSHTPSFDLTLPKYQCFYSMLYFASEYSNVAIQ